VNFFVNLIWKHLLAAVVSNWGTTVNGLIGAILLAGPTLYHTYIEGHSFQTTDWALVGTAAWLVIWNALRAKFSWSSILGAMLSGAPRAQLADMTKENTTKK
jgi:hypothetical protein